MRLNWQSKRSTAFSSGSCRGGYASSLLETPDTGFESPGPRFRRPESAVTPR